ncbi:MAG: T9SS type A sorting domain-containing protein [Crocinitomicaceae bacterium]|nr:T9SS type A sorting domain-containing protein [Crocinitomicaceae bacterium]
MKTTSLIFIFFYCTVVSYSQTPTFEWAKDFGQVGQMVTTRILADANNNFFSVGSFSDTYDMDPNTGINNVTSIGQQDCFLNKFDANGNLLWVKTFGGIDSDRAVDIKLNTIGELVITGYFNLTVDFDPSSNTSNLTSNGGYDIFILKLNSNGDFINVKQIGGSGWDEVFALEVDNNNDIYISGQYSNTVDFDPSAATNDLNANGRDIFVAKYFNNLNFSWAKSFNNSTPQYGGYYNKATSIVVDQSNNIYVCGEFAGTVDFDPSISVTNSITASTVSPFIDPQFNTFLLKLSNSGNLIRADKLPTLKPFLTIDNQDNLLLAGRYLSSSVDFDLNSGTQTIPISGSVALFLLKLDNNFNFNWVKNLGQPEGTGASLVCDNANNVFISESFSGTNDFDPSNANYNLSSMGASNAFITKLTSNGIFIWAVNYGSNSISGNTYVNTIAIDNNNGLISAGTYSNSADMDPSNAMFNLSGGGFYYQKLDDCNATSSTLNITDCDFYSGPNGTMYATSGTYNIVIANAYGCDSLITLNLTILPSQSNSVTITQCNSYTSSQGSTYNSSGAYTETYTSVNGCDSVVTINLTIKQNTTNTITESACGAYTAPDGQVYTQSGVYTATLANNAGCDSVITINLTIGNVNTLVTANGITLTANENGAQYQWINCTTNQAIPTATGQSYTPIVSGDYAVIVTNSLCSDTSDCYTVNDVGIEDLELVELFYPNPAIDYLLIKNNNSSNDLVYVIMDSFGKKVIEGALTQKETQVSLRGLSNGAYFIKIGENLPVKILKQ